MNIWKKTWQWIDDRTGITEFINPLAKHLVPPDATWLYVFGSATLFAFILQVVTGVGLALMYQPTSETAYESLQYMSNHMPLGNILRGIHFWGASAMILLVGIHMIRVYLMAAFKYPREMSWITGSVLLVLIIAMGFTGQLLRWDDNGVWSAVVGAEQAGRIPFIGKSLAYFLMAGETLGGATLSRFFAFHVFLVPALIFGLVGLHLYLVIRNGISEPPKARRPVNPKTYKASYESMLKERGVPFWPNAGWRDGVFGIFVVLSILVLAVVVGPPSIGAPPNLANIYANPRPDWYLLWIFALFALMPREIESFAIAFSPVIIGLIMILLPVIYYKGERSPSLRPWAVIIVIFIVASVVVFWIQGVKSPWSPDFNAKPLSAEVIGNVSNEAKAGAGLFYSKACIYCHTVSGSGGKRGPDLTHAGERLSSDQITIEIINGGGNMPAFGPSMSETELGELVSFLQTRQH